MRVIDLPTNWRHRVKLMRPRTNEVCTRCWVWMGATARGYAMAQVDGKSRILHNVILLMDGRPKPVGLEADHLCNRPLCINPVHIEYVTRSENNRRAYARGRKHWRDDQTHCVNGHEFTAENTMPNAYGKNRRCRTCHNLQTKLAKRLKKQRMSPTLDGLVGTCSEL